MWFTCCLPNIPQDNRQTVFRLRPSGTVYRSGRKKGPCATEHTKTRRDYPLFTFLPLSRVALRSPTSCYPTHIVLLSLAGVHGRGLRRSSEPPRHRARPGRGRGDSGTRRGPRVRRVASRTLRLIFQARHKRNRAQRANSQQRAKGRRSLSSGDA